MQIAIYCKYTCIEIVPAFVESLLPLMSVSKPPDGSEESELELTLAPISMYCPKWSYKRAFSLRIVRERNSVAIRNSYNLVRDNNFIH